jgi:aromatic ring-opening dioxygenase catalytic subunit (LigB family)
MHGEMRSHFDRMEAALQKIPEQLPEPARAVLVISGHWEEPQFSVSASATPGMVYDYYGFPEYTYSVVYPAPGSPQLAERARALLADAGWAVRLEDRGFDHGTFSVMQPIFPSAEVPVVQLSLRHTLDPEEHLAAGRALAPLRDEGVLIIGSGMSYHNLRLFGPGGQAPSAAFDDWLQRALLRTDAEQRWQALKQWEHAPAARAAHPREEHLLPLMVAAGAARQDPATCIYREEDFFGHMHVSSYRFG